MKIKHHVFYIVVVIIVVGCAGAHRKNSMAVLSNDIDKNPAIEYGLTQISRLNEKPEAVIFYSRTADLYVQVGDLEKAEELMNRLTALCKNKIPASRNYHYYNGLDDAGIFYLKTGDFLKSRAILEESDKFRRGVFGKKDPARKSSYLGLGLLAFYENEHKEAIKYFHEYIEAMNHSVDISVKRDLHYYADAHYYYALTLEKLGNYDLALKKAKKAVGLQRHRWVTDEVGANFSKMVDAQCLLAQLQMDFGNYDRALRRIDNAIGRYKITIGLKSHQISPLLITKARILQKKGQLDEARIVYEEGLGFQLTFLKENFAALSEYEKENFYQNIRTNIVYFNQFCLAYLDNNPTNKSALINNLLNWNLATKAIILNESRRLTKAIYNSQDQELISRYEKWKVLKNEYGLFTGGMETKRSEVLSEINNVEKQLLKSMPDINLQFVTWQEIQTHLPKDAVGVEIIRVPFDTTPQYIFLSVTAEGEPNYEVVKDGRRLEKQYKYYNNCIQSDIVDHKSKDVFWGTIASLLNQSSKVYVSPDGIYNLVNLNILSDQKGRFVSEDYDIYNVTSLKDLVNESGSIASLDGLLIGRPQYYTNGEVKDNELSTGLKRELIHGNISDLPGTEKEVIAIKEILEKNDYKEQLLVGVEAEEATIKKMELSPIIHFATHGFFDQTNSRDSDPMFHTGLLLRGAGDTTLIHGEDGILTAYEATTLDLKNTDLVVLSACETGLGTIENGEGVYGLQRAFKVANVDYIIMAMWKVDDSATELLFKTFYSQLVTNKNVHQSLITAQNAVKAQYPEVRYWGAFKIIGI